MKYGKSWTEAMLVAGYEMAGYQVLVDDLMPDRVMAINDGERWVKMNRAQLDRVNLMLGGKWTQPTFYEGLR